MAPSKRRRRRTPIHALKEVISDKVFWRFMLMLALLCLVRMMFQHMHFTWPKYVIREQGEAFPVGKLWSLNSLLILVMAPLGTALTRKRRPFEVLLFGAFISSLSPFVPLLRLLHALPARDDPAAHHWRGAVVPTSLRVQRLHRPPRP
jgi:hypothetical protein